MDFTDVAFQVGGPLAVIFAALGVSTKIVGSVWARAIATSERTDQLSADIAARSVADLNAARAAYEAEIARTRETMRRLEEQISSQQREIAEFAQARAQWMIERAGWETDRAALEKRIAHLELFETQQQGRNK